MDGPISEYISVCMIYIHFDNFADLRRVLDVGFHVLSIYSVYLLERETGGGGER